MRDIVRLLLKLVVLSLPLAFFLTTYLYYDPFRVLYRYDDLYQGHEVPLNRDFASTEVFLHNADRMQYDSYILGNSRTMAFATSDWTPWIHCRAAFHFDASLESVLGIAGKLRLIEKKDLPLAHVLIILDAGTLSGSTDRFEHLYVKHPAVSGGGRFAFQSTFLKSYLSPTCCLPYLAQKLFSRQIPGFHGPFEAENARYDRDTNDFDLSKLEEEIAADPDAYYRKNDSWFATHVGYGEVLPPAATEATKKLLREIEAILARHHTDYRIVINPLWDKRRLNPSDLELLESIFGKDRVFDFSGENEITTGKRNYYEANHYRPTIGRKILAAIYGQNK